MHLLHVWTSVARQKAAVYGLVNVSYTIIIVSEFEKKAHFAQRPNFLFLIAHNFKAVIATGLQA